MGISETYFKAGRRRYYRGTSPCGHCQAGAHESCRPRLDGTLCSCSCERAQVARAEFERKAAAAAVAGNPEPTIKQALGILHPKYEQEFATEI